MTTTKKQKSVVLIVDDSPETLSMLNDALDGEDLTILIAMEGQQAVTIAQSIKPDIILMDAIMPNMDGFEACEIIKNNPALKYTPVIFMTGMSDTDHIKKGFMAGGTDYITKPINPDELIVRMMAHLNNARITIHSQQALDTVGQFLLAVNNSGQIEWATPQTYQLFELAQIDDAWLADKFAQKVAQFIRSDNKKIPLKLKSENKQLELSYITETEDNEYLLKLADIEEKDETLVLRQKYGLTKRESEVLLWISKGKTNREIAIVLAMSPRTVNKHLEQIFKKLGVENRTSAAAMALR
ncbi:DNA-binding response regulator [Gayadomonas joobiniege]|uniref:DNA-binding response regulator n=1 Tax=Gayadomonas joobiniege TaxID=1234606 RepID=UPI0003812050|nr:DNA-binding response regulator [Gayadomonas joobiniege]